MYAVVPSSDHGLRRTEAVEQARVDSPLLSSNRVLQVFDPHGTLDLGTACTAADRPAIDELTVCDDDLVAARRAFDSGLPLASVGRFSSTLFLHCFSLSSGRFSLRELKARGSGTSVGYGCLTRRAIMPMAQWNPMTSRGTSGFSRIERNPRISSRS